jgi:hypothetical protein
MQLIATIVLLLTRRCRCAAERAGGHETDVIYGVGAPRFLPTLRIRTVRR